QIILGGAEANTYTGVTTLNSGFLRLNKSVANIGLTTDLVMNGGTLLKNSNAIADTASVTINGGTFWMDTTSSSGNNNHIETINNFTMNGGGFGNHGSNATLNINGNATLTASELGMNQGGDITVQGTTKLSGGLLRSKESSSTSVFNGLTSLGNLEIENIASGTYTAIIMTSHATNKGTQLTLRGDVLFTGNNTNTNTVKIASSDAALANQGVFRLDGTRTFNVGDGSASTDLLIETALTDGDTAGGLNKTGNGTLALQGESTYTGPTTVAGGRLLINNATGSGTGSGSVTVNQGAALAGTGRVATAAGKSILFSGMLQIGDSSLPIPAAADFELKSEAITFDATSRLEFDLFSGGGDGLGNNITGVDADFLLFGAGQGTVDIASGASLFVNAGSSMTNWAIGDTWKLIDWAQVSSATGSFAFSSNVDAMLASMGLAWDVSQLHTQGTIAIAAVPEPSRAMLLLGGLGLLSLRRRRSRSTSLALASMLAGLMTLSSAIAQTSVPSPAPAEAKANLVTNGDFTLDADGDTWPDGWGKGAGLTWEKDEAGKPFFRITMLEPGKMLSAYREVPIPAGVLGIEVTFKYRTADIKKGKQSWNDARAMFHFLNPNREQLKPTPSAIVFSTKAAEWTEVSRTYLVPEGTAALQMMPSLFQTEAGRLDFAEIRVTPMSVEQIEALKKADAERAAKKALMEAQVAQKRRQQAAALLAKEGSLLTNGNFETESKAKNSPDGWGKGAGISWEKEEGAGNRFIRLASLSPGQTVLLYRDCPVPEGTGALALTWKQRIQGLKKGAKPWFDARIMLEFKGADGKTLPGKPSAPYAQKDTDGWVDKRAEFLVPAEAVSVVVMPALFQVKSGSLDLDDISLKPTDPTAIQAKQREREILAEKSRVPLEEPNKAKWPPAIRAQGNRLVTVEGGKEVWLQGMNVASLEWSVRGEQIQKSIVVGIEQWKGNVIRLPIKDDYWFGKDVDDGGASYRAVVDQAITLAANRGAYLVLDLHRYRAPRKEHLDFWKDAAARYKDHPAVIFDLINEPHGVSWEVWRDGGFVEEKRKDGDEDAFLTPEEKLHNKHGFQSPGMQAMLDAVRSTGAKNMVLVGGLDYAYELDGIVKGYGLKDESGNGIIYACHIYPWKRNWQKMLLDAAAIHPILLGEVGADAKKMDFMPHESQENAETWVPAILGLIQKHRLNWTAWCFHPSASPRMLVDWTYTPTPFWGQQAKDAMSGKAYEMGKLR
ncbi:MAG: cellulase family glycosylhydrolase, partial [Verrucomicrobium sp.]